MFSTRRATIEGTDLLADLGERTFRAAFAEENPPQDMELYVAEAFAPAQIAAEIHAPGSTFLLGYDEAFAADKPVGYTRLLAGPAHEIVRGAKPIELVRIYVEPAALGGGKNERARTFYDRWGFQVVGDHDFVLGTDVQTDLVMARPVHWVC